MAMVMYFVALGNIKSCTPLTLVIDFTRVLREMLALNSYCRKSDAGRYSLKVERSHGFQSI